MEKSMKKTIVLFVLVIVVSTCLFADKTFTLSHLIGDGNALAHVEFWTPPVAGSSFPGSGINGSVAVDYSEDSNGECIASVMLIFNDDITFTSLTLSCTNLTATVDNTVCTLDYVMKYKLKGNTDTWHTLSTSGGSGSGSAALPTSYTYDSNSSHSDSAGNNIYWIADLYMKLVSFDVPAAQYTASVIVETAGP